MGRQLKVIVIALCLMIGVSLQAHDINLRGSQPGVLILPGQNAQTIINANPAGTTFIFAAGVHRMTATLIPRNGDKYLGEKLRGSTRLSVLNGAKVLGPWTPSGGRWFIDGQTQEETVDTTWLSLECQTATHPRCIWPHDIFFNNVAKIHEDDLAGCGPGEWFFDYPADRIWVCDNPTGQVVETSYLTRVFADNAATGVTYRSFVIEKYSGVNAEGVMNVAANDLIEDVEIRFTHGGGIGTYPGSRARRNYAHHNCGYGMNGTGSDIIVEDNEIAYNNIMAGYITAATGSCGYEPFWGAVTKWVWTVDLVLRRNYTHHNHGPGLWVDIQNVGTIFEGNYALENSRGGFFVELSCNAVVRNNWATRNGAIEYYPGTLTGGGVDVLLSPNVEVYGNVLLDNWQGITGHDDIRRGTGISGLPNCPLYSVQNLNVHNNTITSITRSDGRTGLQDDNDSQIFYTNNRFENNTYILGALPQLFFYWFNASQSDTAWVGLSNDEGGSITRP
jgi:hypothetical protein